ncbi:MAG: hypothetical protein HOI80_04910, partial [Alphaproteobacteria bacterium]|nr:hypothetical protein [Alphaproteobacteria bacterium]
DADKSIAEFAGDAQQKIKDWRNGGFFEKLEPHEIKLLQKLSHIAEDLFDFVASDLAKGRKGSNDAITLWPGKEMPGPMGQDFREKNRRNKELVGDDRASNTLPFKRLKTAMDAWCSLWLWPLDKTNLLPSRAEFLQGMAMILEGGFTPDGSLAAPSMAEFSNPAPDFLKTLEPSTPAKDLSKATKKRQEILFRETDVDSLVKEVNWLGVAVDTAKRERFTHFDLIFADILKERGGFDFIVGNPPWAKPTWNEADVIGDIDPSFVIRKHSASEARKSRALSLEKESDKNRFLKLYVSSKGAINVTGSEVFNPFAGGGANNLYRCFIDLTFRTLSPDGIASLIHQDGHLNDPKAGFFRQHCYSRLIKHFDFLNRIKSKNFSEVGHDVVFSLNVYRGHSAPILFQNLSLCFLPSQIDDSFRHDGTGQIPTLKTADGAWDTRGHAARLVEISTKTLMVIGNMTEEGDVPIGHQRFLQPYSQSLMGVIAQFSGHRSLGETHDKWQVNGLIGETAGQNSGLISRKTGFTPKLGNLIYSGPMIHVGNPIYKTPRRECRTKADYDVVDLSRITLDYAPRSNYLPLVGDKEFKNSFAQCKWDHGKSHTDFYRMALRKRIALNTERSLIGTILPRLVPHLSTVVSTAFANDEALLRAHANWMSIVLDFRTKAAGRGDVQLPDIKAFPDIDPGKTAKHRGLRLACLTVAYKDLWNKHSHVLNPLPWHSSDPRLTLEGAVEGPAIWNQSAAFRTDFARRMALVEIDVLVSQTLGLTLEQLIDIYRIYFPVLQQNEAATWYDRNGQIAWTCSKGLPGVGYLEDGKSPSRKNWEEFLKTGQTYLECEAVIDFMPSGPQTVTRTFEGPFDTCDRVEDYKRAWAYFEEHKDEVAVE